MRIRLGMLMNVIFGIGVIAMSFWVTSMALDHWQYGEQPPQVSGPRAIFTLDKARPNWMVVSPSTTTVNVTDEGISLESNMPIYEYQWQTNPIGTRLNTGYTISYEIEATTGKLTIGVLDAINSKWIATKDIGERADMFAFTAPSPQIRVILFGNGPPPTVATISSLMIVEYPR
jgi:hypothetical protein